MSATFSVIVPVLDGERYLAEVLAGVRAQNREVELLVVDSGSTDDSVEIARAAGATVLEIPEDVVRSRPHPQPGGRAHDRRLIVLPDAGRDAAARLAGRVRGGVRARRRRRRRVRPAPAAAGHVGDDRPRADRVLRRLRRTARRSASDDRCSCPTSTRAYRRACWAQVRFDDVRYAEDQAFARAMGARGWKRAYAPQARRAARARLLAAGFRAALLRRVPRPARDERPRRARSACARPCATCAGWSSSDRRLDARAGLGAAPPRALDRPLGHAPRHAQVRVRARVARAPAARGCRGRDLARRGDGRRERPQDRRSRARRRARTSTPRSATWRARAPSRSRRR